MIAGCLSRPGMDLPLTRPVWDSSLRPPASQSRFFCQLSYVSSFQTTITPNPETGYEYHSVNNNKQHVFERALQTLSGSGAGGLEIIIIIITIIITIIMMHSIYIYIYRDIEIYTYIYLVRLGNVLVFFFYGFHRRDSRGPVAAGNH